MKKIIIIGAGMGGLSLAALLAKKGFQVRVFEKNPHPGGRCAKLVTDTAVFDAGATLLLMPEVFSELFSMLSENFTSSITLSRVNPTSRIYYDDNSFLDLTDDPSSMEKQLEKIEPGSYIRYLRFMKEAKKNFDISIPAFVRRSFPGFFSFFNLKNFHAIIRVKGHRSYYARVCSFFKSEKLRAAFSYPAVFIGLHPSDAPGFLSLLSYMEIINGLWYPHNGMGHLSEKLYEICVKSGVNFSFNSPVEQIVTEKKRASGIRLGDGTFSPADITIANADTPYVYQSLLTPGKESSILQKKKYAYSAITIYWTLNTRIHEFSRQHNIFLRSGYIDAFSAFFNSQTLPDEPHFYLNIPSRSHNLAAPEGKDTFMIVVPCGHINPQFNQDWKVLAQKARSAVIRRVTAAGVRDFEKLIIDERILTPKDWEEKLNLSRGSVFGSLGHELRQQGYLRVPNRHSEYKNLYFTGGCTHPGSGVPMVILGSMQTYHRICRECL